LLPRYRTHTRQLLSYVSDPSIHPSILLLGEIDSYLVLVECYLLHNMGLYVSVSITVFLRALCVRSSCSIQARRRCSSFDRSTTV